MSLLTQVDVARMRGPLVEDPTGLWHEFVYRSPHAAYLRRRSRWFEPPRPASLKRCFDERGVPVRRAPARAR